MKQIWILLLMLGLTMSSHAQTFGVIKQYEGTIAKNPVTATIKIIDTVVGGSYYFAKTGEPAYLNGSLHGENMEVKELSDDSVTANFSGTVTPDRSVLKGKWKSDGKEFPYEFKSSSSTASCELGVVKKDFIYAWRINSKGDTLGPSMTSSFCYITKCENPEARIKINQLLLSTDLKPDATEDDFREAALSMMEDDFSSMSDDFDTAFAVVSEDDKKWMDEGASMYKWEEESNWEVLFNEKYLLTVRSLYYEFTGGAHGNYGYSNIVFDTHNGNQITLPDIFKTGFEKQLTSVALTQLERQYKAASVDALTAQGFFLENGFQLNDNFFIQKNGIGFTYSPYEIAAYSLGAIDVFIPWTSIQSLIKADGPLAWAIKK